MSGVVLVQVIQFLTQPIITRLYTPAEFGQFSAIISLVSFIAVFGVFSYEYAVPIIKDDKKALTLSNTLFILAGIVTLIVSPILVIPDVQIMLFGASHEILIFLLPIWLLFAILGNIALYVNNRFKLFGQNAKRSVLCAILSTIGQISFGYLQFGINGLIYSTVISTVVGAIVLCLPKLKQLLNVNKFDVQLLKDNVHLPKHQFTSGVINMSTQMLPVFVLNLFATHSLAGQYALAVKVLSLPALLITGTFAHVFYQEFSQRYNDNNKPLEFIIVVWSRLVLLSIIPCSVLIIFGPNLFAWYFGYNWLQAGEITRYLAISTFFILISSSTSGAFIIIGLSRYLLPTTIFATIFRFIGLYLMAHDLMFGLLFTVLFEGSYRMLFNLAIYLKLKNYVAPR